MHDPKFEQDVQQKLEELSFTPSEAVWEKVQLSFGEKRRRRVPGFWFFLAAAVVVSGVAGVYLLGRGDQRQASGAAQEVAAKDAVAGGTSGNAIRPESADEKSVSSGNTAGPARGDRRSISGGNTTGPARAEGKTVTGGNATGSASADEKAVKSGNDAGAGVDASRTTDGPAGAAIVRSRTGKDIAATANAGSAAVQGSAKENVKGDAIGNVKDVASLGSSGAVNGVSREKADNGRNTGNVGIKRADESVNGTADEVAVEPAGAMVKTPVDAKLAKRSEAVAVLPGLGVYSRDRAAIRAKALATRSAAARSPIQLKKRSLWEAGFAGGFGLSSQNKALFEQPVVVSDVQPNGATINAQVPKNFTSTVSPGLSYWAGITVQRPLKRNLTLTLGLDLHYYSSKVQVGYKYQNNAYQMPTPPNYTPSTLINGSSQTQDLLSRYGSYYTVGNNDVFINRYYFLELPASIIWQLSDSRKFPLFWENGLSLSYLVSSNALAFNPKTGVFTKEGDITNKTQVNLSTAFLVGLPIKGIRLQAGPQIQYGLTTLQRQGDAAQHLFYGGLRVILMPDKKK